MEVNTGWRRNETDLKKSRFGGAGCWWRSKWNLLRRNHFHPLSQPVVNKGIRVIFGGTEESLEVQGEGLKYFSNTKIFIKLFLWYRVHYVKMVIISFLYLCTTLIFSYSIRICLMCILYQNEVEVVSS